MEEKKSKPVSDEAKAEAAKRAAAARKAAQAKKAAGTTRSADKEEDAPEKKPAPKKAAPIKRAEREEPEEAEEETVDEESEDKPEKKEKKPRLEKRVTDEERKSVKGLRIAAIVLWVLAIAAEVGAFFALRYVVANASPTQSWGDPECLMFLGMLVLDAVLCIIAAQLWKKSNRISPCLADSALVRTLWHQLGVIMALVCLLPIGIILLVKSKNLNKQLKTVLLVVCALLFAGATATSVDYKQPSAEEVQQLQEEAVAASSADEVYWTRFGKSYHFDRNCHVIANKADEPEGNVFSGSLDDAFAANRWDPCDYCAGGDAVTDDTAVDTAEDTAGELAPAA